MLDKAFSAPRGRYDSMVDDTRFIALHVFMGAGLGVQQDFEHGAREPAPGHDMSFQESLITTLHHMIGALIVLPLKSRFIIRLLPKSLRRIKTAVQETALYFDELLDQQDKQDNNNTNNADGSGRSLLATLIRAAREDGATVERTERERITGLSRSEMKGDLFIFSFAGHDTTAGSLAYAISLLAVYPEYQAWIQEEMDAVLKDTDIADYAKAFPRLKRCQALMVSISVLRPACRDILHSNFGRLTSI